MKDKIHSIFPKGMIESVNEKGGFFVAGGFFTSLVTRKEINDVDIYFTNKESLGEFIKFLKDDTHWCTFISEKSLNYVYNDWKLQLIHYDYYKNLNEIFESYDYTINMCGWDSRTNEIEMDENFLIHNSQRYLHFNPKTKFPLISALRVQKMVGRGYYIPKNQFVKIMLAVSKLDLKSWEDFKNHCGSLYGLNYVTNDIIGNREFSLENVFEVVENTSFDNTPITEFKIDPRVVDFVLSEEEILYIKLPDGSVRCISDVEEVEVVDSMIQEGSLKAKEVKLEDYIGEYIYKWVTTDLKSHYKKSFQYKLGEWIEAEEDTNFWMRGSAGQLYMSTLEGLESASYNNRGCILKCKYDAQDLVEFRGNSHITFKKVYPVEVFESLDKLKETPCSQQKSSM